MSLPAVVLRLGMIHGPRSYRHWPFVKRLLDARPAVILADKYARWRASLGFSTNVAHAIALAAELGEGPRVYNVAEPDAIATRDLVNAFAHAVSWTGQVIIVRNDELPEGLRAGATFAQDFVLDTQRIRRELGYEETVAFPTGLAATVQWMRAHPPGSDDPMGAFKPNYELEDRVFSERRRAMMEMVWWTMYLEHHSQRELPKGRTAARDRPRGVMHHIWNLSRCGRPRSPYRNANRRSRRVDERSVQARRFERR